MEITDLWIESLQAAYWLARYESSEAKPNRAGLDTYSYVWGQIRALEGLEPVLAKVTTDPVTMREIARAEGA